jgi:hypothetical protein
VFCDDGDYAPGYDCRTRKRYCSAQCRDWARWTRKPSSARFVVLSAEREPWRDIAACRTPWKRGYLTLEAAGGAAREMLSRSGAVLYPYDDCLCGAIHLSRECSPDGSPETLPAAP